MMKILLPFIMSPTTSNLPSIPPTPNIILLREGGEEGKVSLRSYSMAYCEMHLDKQRRK